MLMISQLYRAEYHKKKEKKIKKTVLQYSRLLLSPSPRELNELLKYFNMSTWLDLQNSGKNKLNNHNSQMNM